MMKRVLVLEPYYGGSHKQFLTGLQKTIDAEFHFLTLPARKWKQRMQLSAPWFVECIKRIENRFFDTVLCSTFVDVAVLQALLYRVKGWNLDSIYCTYFHENQFVYPAQFIDKSLQYFASLNYISALSSDRIAFNSEFNWNSFSQQCKKLLKRTADMDLSSSMEQIEEKKSILYPGIDFSDINCDKKTEISTPVVCWNHRWEHDKDPESFFKALREVEDKGFDFKLIVLGQSFQNSPSIFTDAQKYFKDKIIHFGYAETRQEYISLLQKSDIVVSTAIHEFFGVSIIEAIRAGCLPLLPDRLSYPELYDKQFRYKEGKLAKMLAQYLEDITNNRSIECSIDTDRFSWQSLAGDYQKWLFK